MASTDQNYPLVVGCSASLTPFTELTDTLSLLMWKNKYSTVDRLMKKNQQKEGRDMREDLMLTHAVV